MTTVMIVAPRLSIVMLKKFPLTVRLLNGTKLFLIVANISLRLASCLENTATAPGFMRS